MAAYLQRFYERIRRKYVGCLVKVEYIKKTEPNSKEYLNKLARAGLIEKVTWGWYWIPDEVRDPLDFLEKDRGFKVISCQTAASLLNQDFVHRDVYLLKVSDRSYGRALEEFARRRGWRFQVEYTDRPSNYRKTGKLFLEDTDETIIECMSRWAFMDAFAVLYSNRDKVRLDGLSRQAYWRRISGTNVRVRQALEYGCHLINVAAGKEMFNVRRPKLSDGYIKRDIDEAVQRVVELG